MLSLLKVNILFRANSQVVKATDCKSVELSHRWFESNLAHVTIPITQPDQLRAIKI